MGRTKIICTIGPAVASPGKIAQLLDAGMNVARLNFSHGDHAVHRHNLDMLKEARRRRGTPLALMLDTKGPEIRLGPMENDAVTLKQGQRWVLCRAPCLGTADCATLDPPHILDDLRVGHRVLLDDGYIATRVVEKHSDEVVLAVENGGVVRSKKGINVPEAQLSLPAVTPQDVLDLQFGCQHDIDIVAASFVRSAQHLLIIRKLLHEAGRGDALLIAKIENHEGVENFDSIIQVADGIMIARGDLGVEVPVSQVPRLQKMMIRKCYLAGKISVTATQMLESMIRNPRPTRAEVSDVANAIYDGTSAVMLSGETAAGSYPIEAVQTMRTIVEEAEADFNYAAFFRQHSELVYHDVPSAVTLATVKTAYSSGAKCIVACTTSGSTARLLSRLRPSMPIIALTPSLKTYHQLSICWGVTPLLGAQTHSVLEAFTMASAHALAMGEVGYGDLAVVTAGSPFGIAGTTNTMIVENIGNVLVRGHAGYGERVHGNVALFLDPQAFSGFNATGKMLVITKCDERYEALIQQAIGVILQNHIDDLESELSLMEMAKHYGVPVIVRADNAVKNLNEGQLITLDPAKALVYKGVMP